MVEVLVGICLLSHAEVLVEGCADPAKSLAKKRGDSVERHVRGRQVTYWRLRNSRSRYRSQCVDVGQWWLQFALPSWRFATAMRGASLVLPMLSQVTQRSCRTVIDRISTTAREGQSMLDVTGVRAGNKQGCKVDETSRSSKGSVRPCGEQREKARRVGGANSLDVSWSVLPAMAAMVTRQPLRPQRPVSA